MKQYWQKNPAKQKRTRADYKNAVAKNTPIWADFDAMNKVYYQCKELTKTTGIRHEVDHIVPIRGRTVCGLHCQANLQAITQLENRSKLNRIWPDMWT